MLSRDLVLGVENDPLPSWSASRASALRSGARVLLEGSGVDSSPKDIVGGDDTIPYALKDPNLDPMIMRDGEGEKTDGTECEKPEVLGHAATRGNSCFAEDAGIDFCD